MTSSTFNDSDDSPEEQLGGSQDQTRVAGELTNEFARKSAERRIDRTYDQLGPYRVVRKIGEGGMGSVFLAEQESPIRRQVAVKVIKHQLSSNQVISRFEAERQALAMMDHPNIAKVLDAGTAADGSLYFAMELVNGVPFSDFCDSRKLTIQQRLELFLPVCQAVQHAHQKGIIHRDLKPSNVLVGLYDGHAIPKVIDFGLAKATQLQTQLSDDTLSSDFGGVVGTLQYMSPEQAGMELLDIDTRTDVYSLGVMLYEILTGTPPLNKETLKSHALLKILVLIREVDPPRPSIRLTQSQETIASISGSRMIEPRRLHQILRGELDWVVMKSLEKQRSRRYETANALARDIQRYLDNEPVDARPPSFVYRAGKLIRRNRGLALSTTTIFLVLIISLGVITSQYLGQRKLAQDNENIAIENEKLAKAAQIEADRALAEAENQLATSEFLFDVLGAGDPIFSNLTSKYGESIGSSVTVQEVVTRAARLELRDTEAVFRNRPILRAQVLHALADICVLSSEFQLAREALSKSHELLQAHDAGPTDMGKVLSSQGLLDYIFGDTQLALTKLVEAQSMLSDSYAKNPKDFTLLRKLQDSRLALGVVFLEYHRHDDALEQFRQMATLNPLSMPEARMQIKAAKLFSLLIEVDRRLLSHEALWPLSAELGSIGIDLIGPANTPRLKKSIIRPLYHVLIAVVLSIAGPTESAYGQLEEMQLSLSETLGNKHLMNCIPLFLKANYAIKLENRRVALENLNQLLTLVDELLGARKHPRLIGILLLRADLLRELASSDTSNFQTVMTEAVTSLTEAISIGESFYTTDSYQLAKLYMTRGELFLSMGQFSQAALDCKIALNRIGLADRERALPIRRLYAQSLEQIGDFVEATKQIQATISIYQTHPEKFKPQLEHAEAWIHNLESNMR